MRLIALISACLLSTSCVSASLAADCTQCDELGITTHFTLSGKYVGIVGALKFCQRDPVTCDDTKAPAQLVANDALITVLKTVNARVNAAVKQVTDAEQYGEDEYWALPIAMKGDCEDLALAKRDVLIKAGIPSGALQLVILRLTDVDAGHAVLAVDTDRGLYFLDSLKDEIETPFSEKNRVYQYIQVPGLFDYFNAINGVRM